MNKLIIVFLLAFSSFTEQQQQESFNLKLKVVKINELNDCYIFTTVKKNGKDTLYLISLKDSISQLTKYKKISVGKKFYFVIKNRNQSLSIPDKNFRLRVRNTIVWRGDDDFKKYPLVLENTKGLYLIKRDPN